MAFRGNESPMDFEWQGSGPVDPSSPYHKFIMESESRKRPYSQYSSPIKSSIPSLPESTNRPLFFSNIPPTSPYRNPSFTTPRKPLDLDFSSGPENSSPLDATENDETPDAKSPYEFTSNNDTLKSSKPSKRNSLFGMYGRFAPSPKQVPRVEALERRMHKRRRRAQQFDSKENNQLTLRRNSEDTSDDEDWQGGDHQVTKSTQQHLDRSPSRSWPQHPLPGAAFAPLPPQSRISAFFTYLHTHPHLPTILSHYLQLLTNLVIILLIIYLLYQVYATIASDLSSAADAASADILATMSACSRSYVENRCGDDRRLPALETVCNEWSVCMNRDPKAVKRAALSARTFAQIFDSFVEEISLRTLGFTVVMIAVSFVASNGLFVMFRRQYEGSPYAQGGYGQQPQQHHQQQRLGSGHMPPPQTPGRPALQHAYTEPAPQLDYPLSPAWPTSPENNRSGYEQDHGYAQRRLGYAGGEWSPKKDTARHGRSRSPEKR